MQRVLKSMGFGGSYGSADDGEAPPQITMSPALQCLQKAQKIEVHEKVSLLEAATAIMGQEIEMGNKYKVFAGSEKDTGREIFFAAESTGFCTRQLKQCCGDCAPWDLQVLYTEDGKSDLAFKIERGWTLTCCCFNRPVATMTDADGNKIGSLRDPFACCDLTFSIRDEHNHDKIHAKGGCCQWGLCLPLPCGPCSTVSFRLEDASSGKALGDIEKKVPSCCSFLFASDVDNYKVDLGSISDPRLKALVMALSIFIDFRYFNDSRANSSNTQDSVKMT